MQHFHAYTYMHMCTHGHASQRAQRATHPLAQVGVRPVALVEAVLPLHHHPQVLVVEDEGLALQPLDRSGGQLLHQGSGRSV